MKRALITGITGQLGSYLAELLLSKDYEVHGIVRRSSSFNTGRIDHIFDRLHLHHGDMTDATGLRRIVEAVLPDECYALAAQSHVRVSFDQPEYTADVVATGTLRLLEVLRGSPTRMFHASSSEMFGSAPPAQNEETGFHPRSPYAVAKVAAHQYCVNYREAYGMFVSCGILFNAESPRRGETFVTRKVTRAAARIKLGLQEALYLGNLDARRDWNFAGDTVRAIWLMLQTERPSDYVVATEEAHSVRQLLDAAFGYVGIDWKTHVKIDPRYYRPAEVDHLCGDARKAVRELGWRPSVTFASLVRMMVDADLALARAEAR